MQVAELDYELPQELIAQRPLPTRDASRLLVFDRAQGATRHRVFSELADEFQPDDLLVVNDTRVVPGRLAVARPGGGRGEVLLVEQDADGSWQALAKPSRRLAVGMVLRAPATERDGGWSVELLASLGSGRWRVRLDGEPAGATPLPPYINEPLADAERYQTVYASQTGSAAAPTAGLHFTESLLSGFQIAALTLHIGLDTFRPVEVDHIEQHELHGERYSVAPEAWEAIQAAKRVVAAGTTCVRALETVAAGGPLNGRTSLLIAPGHEFRRVDALLTNFHLPRSTLLALVMAFAGVEETRELYRQAVEHRYRFYTFGDAMLIL